LKDKEGSSSSVFRGTIIKASVLHEYWAMGKWVRPLSGGGGSVRAFRCNAAALVLSP